MKIKSGGDANLLLPKFYVLPALSSHLSVFSKLCIMHTPLHFLLLLCQSCRSLRNVSFGGHILGLIKSAYHGWLSMMTSSEGPLFSLTSPHPTLNPPLVMRYSFDENRKETAKAYFDEIIDDFASIKARKVLFCFN